MHIRDLDSSGYYQWPASRPAIIYRVWPLRLMTHYGKVSGYSIDPPLQGNDPSHVTITVHRGNRNYQIHLQLKLEGNDWKIVSADGV